MKEPLSQRIGKYLPSGILRRLMPVRKQAAHVVRKSLAALGYNVIRIDDYYSPLPDPEDLKRRFPQWNKPSALYGICYNLDEMKTILSELLSHYLEEFNALPPYAQIQEKGFGAGYSALDGLVLYMILRQFKPKRYLEVGSGVSTFYTHLAAQQNELEGAPMQLECIEPHPYPALDTVPGILLHRQAVQDVNIELFQSLGPNDILFIDSSHVIKIGGDVPFLFLEVLPRLPKGVLVHIHDVPFPYNIPYPPKYWIFERPWPKFWNEAMLLQAFLYGNQNFRILLSTPLIRYFDETFLRASIPGYQGIDENPNTFSSIWLQRI
jgi:hypothetical protein